MSADTIERFAWDTADVESVPEPAPPDFLEEGGAKAYDPHEARDDHGRWTDGPGGGVDDIVAHAALPTTNLRLGSFYDNDRRDKAEELVKGIESVHTYPRGTPATRIEVRYNLPEGINGDYDASYEVAHLNPSWSASTMIHELGHKLDHALGLKEMPRAGDKAYLSAFANPAPKDTPTFRAMSDVMAAIRHSDAYATLHTGPMSGNSVPFPGYWERSHELFARAYAQYMVDKLGEDVAGLPMWDRANGDAKVGVQWKPEDFKPIARALDRLLADSDLATAAPAGKADKPTKRRRKPHQHAEAEGHVFAENEHPRDALGRFAKKPQDSQEKPKKKTDRQLALAVAEALRTHNNKLLRKLLREKFGKIPSADVWRAWVGEKCQDIIKAMMGDTMTLNVAPGDGLMWGRLSYLLTLPPAVIAKFREMGGHLTVDDTKTLGELLNWDPDFANQHPAGYPADDPTTLGTVGGAAIDGKQAYLPRDNSKYASVDDTALHEIGHVFSAQLGWQDDPWFIEQVKKTFEPDEYFYDPVEAGAQLFAEVYGHPQYALTIFGKQLVDYARSHLP